MKTKLNGIFLLIFSVVNLFGQYDSNAEIWIDDLEVAMNAPERVFNLDLSNKGLNEIPVYLQRFPNLISLKLSDNKINSLNNNLSNLKKLEFLELSGNDIKEINFQYLEELKYSLKELWLRDNDLQVLDSSINVLEYLEVLNIGNNQIHRIDTNVTLRKIRVLSLDNNELKEIPRTVHHSLRLSKLNLNGNHIKYFELTTYNRNLLYLNLGDNPLVDFKVESVKHKLEVLILDWIKIKDIWLLSLPPTLTSLSMEHCEIKTIGKIAHLRRLKELSVISNELVTISNELSSLRRLEKIWIGDNPISNKEINQLSKRLIVKH